MPVLVEVLHDIRSAVRRSQRKLRDIIFKISHVNPGGLFFSIIIYQAQVQVAKSLVLDQGCLGPPFTDAAHQRRLSNPRLTPEDPNV